MGKKSAKLYSQYHKAYTEQGDQAALEAARALLENQHNIAVNDRERLFGFLEGGGRMILPEPQPLLTRASKMPGLDGQKMSKSYGNVISLRDEPAAIEKALKTMPTDTNRIRRTDPGDPARCPVWQFHEVYSEESVKTWADEGCRSAAIGCLECKQPVIDAVLAELKPIQQQVRELEQQPKLVRTIIAEGNELARDVAQQTMEEVRRAMSLELF